MYLGLYCESLMFVNQSSQWAVKQFKLVKDANKQIAAILHGKIFISVSWMIGCTSKFQSPDITLSK